MTTAPKPTTDKPQLDHDGDGKAGGSLPKAERQAMTVDALRERAAKQANRQTPTPEVEKRVEVQVTRIGDGLISTGIHAAGIGEVHYEKDETFEVGQSIADELELKGWVIIL